MSSLKPLTLYAHVSGPNPWKVVIILRELNIPYTTTFVEMSQIKSKPFTDINPNGRVPAIVDPNTGITLWESGAINTYLVDTYDKEGKLTYREGPEKYQVLQWLMFQMSGQGPYYGQAAWFTFFHPEKLPSARERYTKEMERVIAVLDGWLRDHPTLVGDKITYADLAFIPWHFLVDRVATEELAIDVPGKYPAYQKWIDGMLERPAVKAALEEKAEAAKGH